MVIKTSERETSEQQRKQKNVPNHCDECVHLSVIRGEFVEQDKFRGEKKHPDSNSRG